MEPLLKVSNLVKRFGGIVAVNDVSFEVYKGETWGSSAPTARANPRS
jgi:ABC-type branched-subunit amino acid transport system ATPase component